MDDSKKNMDKKAWRRRDILSILMRANMMHDIPESQRMSDEDVLARQSLFGLACFLAASDRLPAEIPTFLVAGHETTR